MGDGGDLRNYNQQPTLNKCCIIYALKLFSAAWVRVWLCKLQKRCIRLPAASDNVYHLLVHGRKFSLGTLASSTTKTGLHDITEILLKVAIKHEKYKKIKSLFRL